MSDSSEAEKTEEATPKKKQEAADEGKVPRSAELGTATLLLGGAMTVSAVIPTMGSQLVDLFGSGLRSIGNIGEAPGAAVELLQGTGKTMVGVIVLMAAGTAATALAVSAVQARGVLTMQPLEPKWGRLNPIENGKRMVGAQPIVELPSTK